jgi:hypothetical protein
LEPWGCYGSVNHFYSIDAEVIMLWVITFGLAGYLCFKAWGFLVTIGKLSFWLLRIII